MERPIIFSGPMVRAILEGRKTQTRRVIKPQPTREIEPGKGDSSVWFESSYHAKGIRCPYGKPGDQLWVRESGWQPKDPSIRELRDGADTWPQWAYSADGYSDMDIERFKQWGWKSRPSIHMPRWASRITLEITNVRVELLQYISEEDAKAEGVTRIPLHNNDVYGETHREAFERLWDKINGKKHPWSSNPYVWVIEFRRKDGR